MPNENAEAGVDEQQVDVSTQQARRKELDAIRDRGRDYFDAVRDLAATDVDAVMRAAGAADAKDASGQATRERFRRVCHGIARQYLTTRHDLTPALVLEHTLFLGSWQHNLHVSDLGNPRTFFEKVAVAVFVEDIHNRCDRLDTPGAR